MLSGLFSVLVITSAAAQSCPANQIDSDAHIIFYTDDTFPESSIPRTAIDVDTNLTFLSEVLGYSDNEIQQEVQNALQFFSERFGLDFSPSETNEQGLRFFQNATLQPLRRIGTIYAIMNRWILTGNTRSKCFLSQFGGFLVTFSGGQILKGTYGGEEGIKVPDDIVLSYDYVSIAVSPPCEPIVMLRRTPVPIQNERFSRDRFHGLSIVFHELSHDILGQGSMQGILQVERFTAANGTSFVRGSGSAVATFPPNVLTFN